MKKLILQYWEESERGWGIRPDGCSLHLDKDCLNKYVDSAYKDRDPNNVPHEYDRIVGDPIEIWITEEIYNETVSNGGSLRIPQHSMTNLRKMKEMQPIVSYDDLN